MTNIRAGVLLLGAALSAGCGAGVESPSQAYRAVGEHARRGQWDAFYDRMSGESRGQIELLVLLPQLMGGEKGVDLKGREVFVEAMSKLSEDERRRIQEDLGGRIIEERVEGERAILVVDRGAPKPDEVVMLKEEGQWRLHSYLDMWHSMARRRGTDPELEKNKFLVGIRLPGQRELVNAKVRQMGRPPEALEADNPLSPPQVARKLVVVHEPGADGTAVDPASAGWVWNDADRKLHAAGFDEKADLRAQWEDTPPYQKEQELRTLLAIARGAVARHRQRHGSNPDLIGRQWGALADLRPLANRLSPEATATKIVEAKAPGADGTSIDPASAGWVWNAAEGKLYLAGFDEHRSSEPMRRARSVLQSARSSIELFQIGSDRSPWTRGKADILQWKPLIDAECMGEPPWNPLSSKAAATRLIESATPGANGMGVDPGTAGWVWNSADDKLYAAGCPE